jgi:hypothetical protein
MPKLRLHSSNRGMPCFVIVFDTFQGTWDQADEDPGVPFCCTANVFSNITYREIQRPGMLIAQKISPVSLVGCTNDRHNRHSGRKLIFGIPPPITSVHLAIHSTTLGVCKVHQFEIELCLKWNM